MESAQALNGMNTEVTSSVGKESSSPGLLEIAKSTFLAWERLRILYVALLGLLTLALSAPYLNQVRAIVMIIEGAVTANICFFAGPILETYARWLGYEGRWLRLALFIGGTLFTAALAVTVMASMFLPNQS